MGEKVVEPDVHFKSMDCTAHALVLVSGHLDHNPWSEAEGDGESVMTEAGDTRLHIPAPVPGPL